MDRLLLVFGGIAVAVLVAALLSRRQRPVPASNTHHIPRHLNREDFKDASRPWLVAVFTASTCATCSEVMERAGHLASSQVSVQELELDIDGSLHERYGIDAVPMLLIADGSGAVQRAFLGPVNTTDLWASLAELREPGSAGSGSDPGGTVSGPD